MFCLHDASAHLKSTRTSTRHACIIHDGIHKFPQTDQHMLICFGRPSHASQVKAKSKIQRSRIHPSKSNPCYERSFYNKATNQKLNEVGSTHQNQILLTNDQFITRQLANLSSHVRQHNEYD